MSVRCICLLKVHVLLWHSLELWEKSLIIKRIIIIIIIIWDWDCVSEANSLCLSILVFIIFGPKQLEKNIAATSLLMWNVNVTFSIMSTPYRPIFLFLSLFSPKTLLSTTIVQHNSCFSIRLLLIILRVPSRHIIMCIMKSQHLCVISFFPHTPEEGATQEKHSST